jgi:prevent-host-death family protein
VLRRDVRVHAVMVVSGFVADIRSAVQEWETTPRRDPQTARCSRSRRGGDETKEIIATLCHTMDVSVRELRNHTGRVVAAIEAGEAVVLTVHGRPVADILPRRVRSERRPSELLLAGLRAIDARADELGVSSDAADFDVGLSTDDM